MAEWSKLHGDLLVEISRRIGVYEDFVSFSRVCCSWREAAVAENFRYDSIKIPWLMLPRKTSDNPNYNYNLRSFLCVSTGKIRQVLLPEVNGKRYFSSKGWLITLAQDLNMTLLHPFSRTQIKLPNLKTFENFDDLETRNNMVSFIRRCALSASPLSESNYILMAIHGQYRNLGYYKPGNKSWITIKEWQCAYKDVAYYDGQFYATDCSNRIVACDFRGRDTPTVTVVASIPEHIRSCPYYLVESAGSLLVVARLTKREWGNSRSKRTSQTIGFKVFQVEFDAKTCTEVKDLGNRAIFLGYNSSSSFSVEDSLTKPNCIYFTDDNYLDYRRNRIGGGNDMGIYNVKDENINLQFWGNLCHRLNPPTWV